MAATLDAQVRVGTVNVAVVSIASTDIVPPDTADDVFNAAYSSFWPSMTYTATIMDEFNGLPSQFWKNVLSFIQSVQEKQLADGRIVRVITITPP